MIPKVLIKPLIQRAHEYFIHGGIQKVFKIIKERFYYKKLKSKIKQTIRVCDKCQCCKSSKTAKAAMQYIIPDGPMDIISVDHLGPFPPG